MVADVTSKPLDPRLRQYVGGLVARNYTAHEIRELLIQSCLVWFDTASELGEVPEEERKEVLVDLEHRLRRMSLGMIVAALNGMLQNPSYPPAQRA